jgi:hypothetical protein
MRASAVPSNAKLVRIAQSSARWNSESYFVYDATNCNSTLASKGFVR